MRTFASFILSTATIALIVVSTPSLKAGNIGHVENAGAGQFLSSTGAVLALGGVSVGYFTIVAPTLVQWGELYAQSITNGISGGVGSMYDRLTSPEFGYTDVRSLVGATPAAGFDWDFAPPTGANIINGVVNNIDISILPQGTQLYILAFNKGAWNANAALSWLSANEWAAVSATGTTTWQAPSNLGTSSLVLNLADTAPEVPVGTDTGGASIRLAPVPEPSGAMLLSAGMIGLFSLRRRNSRA